LKTLHNKLKEYGNSAADSVSRAEKEEEAEELKEP